MTADRGFRNVLAIQNDRLDIFQLIPCGWQARYSFQPDGTDLRLVAVEVTPGSDPRFLSAECLRSLSPAGAAREAHRLAQANPETLKLMDDLQRDQRWARLARRPRGQRSDDRHLAAIASEYVRLVQAGHRSPAAAVATSLGLRDSAQARDLLRRARDRLLLSKIAWGVAGGKLTTKAEALLASADQEE